MSSRAKSLDEIRERRLETWLAEARTLPRNPRSTVEPPRHDTDAATRRALDAFETLSASLRARTQEVLELARGREREEENFDVVEIGAPLDPASEADTRVEGIRRG